MYSDIFSVMHFNYTRNGKLVNIFTVSATRRIFADIAQSRKREKREKKRTDMVESAPHAGDTLLWAVGVDLTELFTYGEVFFRC